MKKAMQQPMIIPANRSPFLIKEEDIKKYLVKMPRQTIEIVFFGSDPWSIYVLKALEDNFDVKLVVTAPDSAVANYFKGPVLTPEKLDKNFKFQISNFKFDLAVVASYGKIIPQEFLDIPKYGALNVHPSLLPKYRGPSPVPATILNGDKITGVTIIKMDEKMDHGPIITTKEISLSGRADSLTLINLLFQVGTDLLVKIIPDYIAGKVKLELQDHTQAVYCPLLIRQSGYFDINNPPSPEILDRMIRAYHPWPGVWTNWKGKIVKFLPVTLSPVTEYGVNSAKGISSKIYSSATSQNDRYLIQMEGKKPIPFKDFLNGYPDFPITGRGIPSHKIS